MEFIFKLGFSGKLAELELTAVLGEPIKELTPHEYLVTLPDLVSLNRIANRLGGLVEVTFSDTNKTVWRHSAKYWQKMDRSKPYLVLSKGLLPPKVARQLVNLAIGPDINEKKSLLDPFCGSGTILMEAAHLGLQVIGADQDRKQLAGAEKNLNWVKAKHKLILTDATHISKHVEKVDYIVTEPFLGKARYQPHEVENIVKGLKKLYLGALKDWQKILPPGGKIVMIFPVFTLGNKEIITGDIVDHEDLSGYNTLQRGIFYSRPGAQIKREIVILEKSK